MTINCEIKTAYDKGDIVTIRNPNNACYYTGVITDCKVSQIGDKEELNIQYEIEYITDTSVKNISIEQKHIISHISCKDYELIKFVKNKYNILPI